MTSPPRPGGIPGGAGGSQKRSAVSRRLRRSSTRSSRPYHTRYQKTTSRERGADVSNYLIYGANGYTAKLIARMATERGQRPILAGRNSQAVTMLARPLGLPTRIFPLDD